ncbi:MAG TPA: choice-of-anchor D domain-containing protein, partial [Thermomicrobiales bacterium]
MARGKSNPPRAFGPKRLEVRGPTVTGTDQGGQRWLAPIVRRAREGYGNGMRMEGVEKGMVGQVQRQPGKTRQPRGRIFGTRKGRMVRLRQAVHFFTIVSLVVSLLGTSVQVALAAPSLSFSPPSRDFGSQQLGTSSAAQTFTVTNTSNAGESIQISSVAAVNGGEYGVGTPAFFQVINGGSCTTNTVLAPTETCTVQVIFKPQAFPTTPPDPNTIPTVNGQLQIATTAGGAPFAAALTGTITSVAPTYVPASLQFGNVPVGTNAPTKIITLTNPSTSGGTLRVTKVDFVNPSLIPEFYRANDSCTDAALEPGDSCTIGVTFTPGQIGFRTDTLRFETSSPSQNAIQDIVVDGTGVASPLTVNPQGLTFTQATGTTGSPQTVTLSNNSGATVILGNPTVAIVGGVSSPFDILSTTCDAAGATLANGESCTVDVNFVAPTTAGTSTDAVAFTYQQPDGTVQVISASLTGTATAPAGAAVIVNPTSVDFGTVAAGATSGTQTVTLLNNRATPLIFGSPGVQTTGGTPADFEIVSTSCPSAGNSLAAFATCNAIVRFTPQGTTAGNRATTLRFNDGGPGGPHDVPLQGAVAASPTPTRQLSFSTQILSFGPIQAGGTTPSQTV